MPATKQTRITITAQDKTKVALKSVKANLRGIGGAVTGLHGQLIALAGVGGFGALLSGVVETNREFQNLMASLETVTGSAGAAEKAFEGLEQFATSTPYQLGEVVTAFTKLKAYGLDPSEKALTAYGNTASAMGKSLDQMIEAVADSATGEFERLKEFGIRAAKMGDNVKLTFRGVSEVVGINAEEIGRYLQEIGNNQFAGGMQRQMNTIGGAFSNLGDTVDKFRRAVGQAGLNDLVIDLTRDVTAFVESIDPKQVSGFMQGVIGGFADLIDGVDAAYKYISANRYLQASGIVGYALFGKWGIGGALLMDQLTDKIGADVGKAWQEFNPSQVVPGSGGFGGQFNSNPLPGYQPGDFGLSNGRILGHESILRIREKYGDKMAEKQDETNSILQDIADGIRERSVAVAG